VKIRIVLDERDRFVEIETPEGRSIHVGKWIKLDNGYNAIELDVADESTAPVEVVMTKAEVENFSSQAGLASIHRQPIDMIFIGGTK